MLATVPANRQHVDLLLYHALHVYVVVKSGSSCENQLLCPGDMRPLWPGDVRPLWPGDVRPLWPGDVRPHVSTGHTRHALRLSSNCRDVRAARLYNSTIRLRKPAIGRADTRALLVWGASGFKRIFCFTSKIRVALCEGTKRRLYKSILLHILSYI